MMELYGGRRDGGDGAHMSSRLEGLCFICSERGGGSEGLDAMYLTVGGLPSLPHHRTSSLDARMTQGPGEHYTNLT